MINITKNVYLIKGLQAMLMIIPQGESFNLLKNRIKCVSYFANVENSFTNNPERDEIIESQNKEYRELYYNRNT